MNAHCFRVRMTGRKKIIDESLHAPSVGIIRIAGHGGNECNFLPSARSSTGPRSASQPSRNLSLCSVGRK